MAPCAKRLASRYLASQNGAKNVALQLLKKLPDKSLQDLSRLVRERSSYLLDPVSRQPVDPEKVIQELATLWSEPEPFPLTGNITVYTATDKEKAKTFLRRGSIPNLKPKSRVQEYAPGRGLDEGLYVGDSISSVQSYGPVVMSVTVPKSWLEVPTELAQLGYKDPVRALHSHDGAVITKRIPAKAFKVMK